MVDFSTDTKFNSKSFNPVAFGVYMESQSLPDLKRNELLRCGALTGNSEIQRLFSTQTGTYYARMPFYCNIGGEELNYDGETDIYPTTTNTAERGVVTYGRAKAWTEKDFSYDITGGVDFMAHVRTKIQKYRDDRFQERLLAILSGLFSMSGDENNKFVTNHTFTVDASGQNRNNLITALNTALQQACGENQDQFNVVLMPSIVATALENLNCLEYLKYTDSMGVQRSLKMATWNGIRVIIDDSLPFEVSSPDYGSFTITVGGTWDEKDKITFNFPNQDNIPDKKSIIELVCGTSLDPKKGMFRNGYAASDISKILQEREIVQRYFDVKESSGTLTFKRKYYGMGLVPSLFGMVSESGSIDISEITGITQPKPEYYVLYALGSSAFEYVSLGAKVPYEMSRDPAKNGGEDTLYIRYRECIAPKGFSYEKKIQASLSPTNEELKNGNNWTLINSVSTITGAIEWFDHKAIPICKIKVKL